MDGNNITDVRGLRPGTPVEIRNYDITGAMKQHIANRDHTISIEYDEQGRAYIKSEYDLVKVG